jgi:hypothetical protein
MTCLRDTFASHLLTAGVQLGYVSSQLGHSDVSVTARHYAKWIEDDRYRETLMLEPDEVPSEEVLGPHEQRSHDRSRVMTNLCR